MEHPLSGPHQSFHENNWGDKGYVNKLKKSELSSAQIPGEFLHLLPLHHCNINVFSLY